MPIISKVGRRSASVRMLFAMAYFILIVGGATMLYPFLLMVSTSLTGPTDYKDFRLVPRYLYDTESRFVKFLSEKYQRADDYSDLHTHRYRSLSHVGMPTYQGDPSPPTSERIDKVTGRELPPRVFVDADFDHLRRRVELWREFQKTLQSLEFGVWCVGRRTMPGKVEMLWRTYLRQKYKDDIEKLNRELGKDLVAFTEGFAPYEKPTGRLWPGVQGAEGRVWSEFKETLDPRYRRPVEGTVLWRRYLRFKYENTEELNRELRTDYADIDKAPLPVTLPKQPELAREWEYFVRNELPYRFVAVSDGHDRYRRFLSGSHSASRSAIGQLLSYVSLRRINQRLKASYSNLSAIEWPPRRTTPSELDAISRFLRTGCDAEHLSVASPEVRYTDFLQEKFGGRLARLNEELGSAYSSFGDIRPPYEEEDLWEFQQDEGDWMSWFLLRNYGEVVDYIAIRGRALWNTVILVLSMIFCALTINPLAAYALSRFRLSYSNQVLLFLLATMAFPHEVAMIPNFLLLRSFPLWTWLVGFSSGLVVAALVLRATLGAKRLLAIPAGLGTAVIAGFYITPLIGRLLGVQIGPVSLLNTYAALILPRMASGYGIFLLKGFFDSLPEELFEAGRIDGAGELWMLWEVAFPLSKPIFAVMALQTFTAIYGSYLWALIVCQSDKMWTLMVYIFQLQQWAPYYVTMAATVLASLPTLLVFIFAQNTIMRGIIIPAYK